MHLAALPDGRNGCLLSKRLARSPLFRLLAWKQGADLSRPADSNQAYLSRLLEQLSASRRIGRAVLLAVDGVYDGAGRLDESKTDFLISNDHVLDAARRHPGRFWPGASVNPRRRDALDELARCAEAGAVLVKVLPNSQLFDPADRAFVPFYRALARLKLPLLSHVGHEFALLGRDQSAGEPDRLRLALEEGVTVIAAHGGGAGLPFSRKYFADMRALFEKYPRFHADLSSVSLPNRCQTLSFLARHPEIHDRLLFGTDYPVPVLAWTSLGRIPWREWTALGREPNPFDRQFRLLEARGVGFGFFRKGLGYDMAFSGDLG